MMTFLFGVPGTGKTYTVNERIRRSVEAGHRVLLIVPEQQLYSSEAAVLPSLPPAAGLLFSVVSFSRLCGLIADRCGGRTFRTLSRASKTLLMWRNLRELRGMLQFYTVPDNDDTSLCRLMQDAVTELSVNAIPPARLEQAAKRFSEDKPIRGKLLDISLAAAAYEGLTRDLCGSGSADRMTVCASQAAESDFFRDADVYVDSFTSFTPEEYALLRPILSQAASVTVTVCAEGRRPEQLFFESIRDTVRRLTRLCESCGSAWSDEVLTEQHRPASPTLRILGRELWNFSLPAEAREPIPAGDDGALTLITAPNMYEEARCACLHVGALHRAGIPYGKIAVVVRDTAEWRSVLDAALEQADIPFFLSERTGLSDKPAARLLLGALKCIRRGYLTGDVVSLAKTGLCGIRLRDLDAFSDYVETWRISGRRMTEGPWSMNPAGYTTERTPRDDAILSAANRVREKLIPPLLELETALKNADSPTDQCRALFDYLTRLRVREAMTRQAKKLLSLGRVREAGEAVRLWTFITEMLTQIISVLPDEEEALSVDELSAALSIMLDGTDIGSVPARHDCVTVGSASSVRLENVEAVLMLGLCEGEFPRAVTDKGLLTEQDKSALEQLGFEFDTRAERMTGEELLFVWRAVTKADSRLLLFTHESTPDGTSKSPSIVFSRVRWLFPDLVPIRFREAWTDTDGSAVRYQPPLGDRVRPAAVRARLSDEIWLSHSALQTYGRCPYSFWGSRILRLREKAEARIDASNAGIFLHHVLEHYLRASLDERRFIRHLSPEEIGAAADRIIDDYIRTLSADAEGDGRILHLFARLRHVALVMIHSVQAELEQGSFSVAGLEWDSRGKTETDPQPMVIEVTMDEDDSLPDPILPVPDGGFPADSLLPVPPQVGTCIRVKMGGRIDRVDTFRAGDTVYVRVVDYKSSKHVFDERNVIRDANVQLLLYLFTLCAPRNRRLFADENGILPERVLPAEVLYISPKPSADNGLMEVFRSGLLLDDARVLDAASATHDTEYLPGLKCGKDGILTGKSLSSREHLAELEEAVTGLIRDTTRAIYSGYAARKPSPDACRFCALTDTCPCVDRTKLK